MHKLKDFIKRKYSWILFVVFLTIFLTIAAFVFRKNIFEFDLRIYNFLVSHRNESLNTFFTIITTLGNALTLIVITALSIILFKDKKYKILIPLNLAAIGLLNYVLKHIFLRPRPNNLRLIDEKGYSFPSGHAMASTAFYGILIYIAYNHVKDTKKRNSICLALSILILLIDISRVYVGVHYASDVLAGTCFSIAYLIMVLKVIRKREKKKEEKEVII